MQQNRLRILAYLYWNCNRRSLWLEILCTEKPHTERNHADTREEAEKETKLHCHKTVATGLNILSIVSFLSREVSQRKDLFRFKSVLVQINRPSSWIRYIESTRNPFFQMHPGKQNAAKLIIVAIARFSWV